MIREATEAWSRETCVRFHERDAEDAVPEPHLVFTRNAGGCRSWVGRTTTEQQINLAPICFYNTVRSRCSQGEWAVAGGGVWAVAGAGVWAVAG